MLWRRKSGQEVLDSFEETSVEDRLSILKDIVGRLFRLELYEETIPIAERACALASRERGTESVWYAQCLYNLATLRFALKQYHEALPLCSRAIEIAQMQDSDHIPAFVEKARALLAVLHKETSSVIELVDQNGVTSEVPTISEPLFDMAPCVPPASYIPADTSMPAGGDVKTDDTALFATPATPSPELDIPRGTGLQDLAADSDIAPHTPEDAPPGPDSEIDTPLFDSAFGRTGGFSAAADTSAPTQAMEMPMFGADPNQGFDADAFGSGAGGAEDQDLAAYSDFAPDAPPAPDSDIDTPLFDSAFGGPDFTFDTDTRAPFDWNSFATRDDITIERSIDPSGTLANVPPAIRTHEIGSTIEQSWDPVDCSVFSPPKATRGDQFMVQVFIHAPEQADAAQDSAILFDEDAQRRAYKSLGIRIEYGTPLDIDLVIPGLEIDDPIQSLVWAGRPEAVQFGVLVPGDFGRDTAIATVGVSTKGIPLGHVKFKLGVVGEASQADSNPSLAGDRVKVYRKAFISYASSDRDKVLMRVQMLKLLGIVYFQDVLDLNPGERWEREIYRNIDDADLLLLFWSNESKNSTWVRKEVEYALNRRNSDALDAPEIWPVLIEGPPVPLPWEELSHLHFNDKLLHFISG